MRWLRRVDGRPVVAQDCLAWRRPRKDLIERRCLGMISCLLWPVHDGLSRYNKDQTIELALRIRVQGACATLINAYCFIIVPL